MSNFCKTLSNYVLNVPFTSPNSSEVCSSFTIQIFVWKGDKYLPPSVPVQEITKNNLDQSAGTAVISIDDIVNDYIVANPEKALVTQLINNTNTAWLKTHVFYSTNDESDLNLPQLVDVRMAVKGYGYELEEENPQPPTNRILIPINDYLVSKYSFFNVPIVRLDDDAPAPVYEVTLDSVTLDGDFLEVAFTDNIPIDLKNYSTIKVSTESDMSIITNSITGSPNSPRLILVSSLPVDVLYFTIDVFDLNGVSATSNIVSYDNS